MIIQSFKRIIKSDYAQEFQQLVETLGNSINIAFDNINNVLNRNVSLKDNIACTLKTVQLTVNDNGTPNSTITINLASVNAKAIGASVINVVNSTSASTIPTGQPFINFSQNNNTVIVNNITNLQKGNTYQVTIVVWHQ